MVARNKKDFEKRFPNQKKNPNALWKTDTVNFLGVAPLLHAKHFFYSGDQTRKVDRM